MPNDNQQNRQALFSWLKTFLKDRGLQFSLSGFKGGDDIGRHVINTTTGYWNDIPYSSSKPPRLLLQIDLTGQQVQAQVPANLESIGVGGSNTAQGDKAGLAFRILPLLKTGIDTFTRQDDFEIDALFIFHGPLSPGSSSDAFAFNLMTGDLTRATQNESYIFAGLLGLRPLNDVLTIPVGGQQKNVTYGEVLTAVQNSINTKLKGQDTLTHIPLYDLSVDEDLERLKSDIKSAWDDAGEPEPATPIEADEADEDLDFSNLNVPENPDLLGIDPAVYRQINALLQSGKQHLMLYGPPGTGKTSLARWIANSLPGGKWTLITGSSDWSSQDIIGGYQPVGNSEVDFIPGILLKAFDQPLIIDEMNRCDIDKVIGPLFTVLSGQQTTLPYRLDLSDKDSQPYVILPKPKASIAEHEFAPGPGWRLIATINSIDKASLYQMSYALSRRFGWVYVDAPKDLKQFLSSYVSRLTTPHTTIDATAPCPIADLWQTINSVRVIGPAPIIDCINLIRSIDSTINFFAPPTDKMRSAILDAFDMVLLPMLDGIMRMDAEKIADASISIFNFSVEQQTQVKNRLASAAI